MKRIESLRQRALSHSCNKEEFYYLFYKKYFENEDKGEFQKYRDAFYTAFSQLTPSIGEGELIVGQINNPLFGDELTEWKNEYLPRADARRQNIKGQDSHMAIDYDLLLTSGIVGVIDRIDGYLKTAEGEKAEFYNSVKTCLLAVVKHSDSYAELAERLANEAEDKERREELLNIARICRRVPKYPAESFYEAVQSTHFLTYCLTLNPLRPCHQQFQLGRPDRYLYPFYKKDIESGNITKEKAQLLLDCLGIQVNMRVPHGLSSGYMVGGRNEKGEVVANELTEMLIKVVDDVRLVYPAVGFCYTADTPKEYLEYSIDVLSKGRSHPAIFNDDLIAEGLMRYGVPKEDSHSYIQSTCVEITPIAASNVWVASPYTNMAALLLETMDREYSSLEEHIDRLLEILDERIKNNFEEQNRFRALRVENSENPLLSAFVDDCLERGEDAERGGSRYNWIMPSFVGMANLVDSIYAIKTLVYDNKEYTVRGLKAILDKNFEGEEPLRIRILNEIVKYGNDVDGIDKYFDVFTKHISNECRKYTAILSEGRLIPSVFCWVKHELFGRETGATPDGRAAGFPLGDGSGPCQGREMNGPTASILSSTKWDHTDFIGGVAVNMKFSKSNLGQNSKAVMKSLIEAFMARGGFEIQINVTDSETLKKAVDTPELYRDLVVRIGGYSDYFTTLSKEMQRELIMRTEHSI